ncbi:MAG: GAF domain-containing protein [Chloroflexota bacterium]
MVGWPLKFTFPAKGKSVMLPITSRPIDATLTVTKAARLLGVHPNTVRAWSDQGRLRFYRINRRGDRRYRVGDLNRFLAAADSSTHDPHGSALTSTPDRPRGTPGGHHATAQRAPFRPSLETAAEPVGDDSARSAALGLVGDLAALIPSGAPRGANDLATLLMRAARAIRSATNVDRVAIYELRRDELVPLAVTGPTATRSTALPRTFGVLGSALAGAPRESGVRGSGTGGDPPVIARYPGTNVLPAFSDSAGELAVAIPGSEGSWGVLVLANRQGFATGAPDLLGAVAGALGAIVRVSRHGDEVAHRLHRAEALRRVESDIGSRLDLEQILSGLVDHALVLFESDRAAVFLQTPGGGMEPRVSRGLSAAFLAAVKDLPPRSLSAAAVAARRPLAATHYRDDPRGEGIRAAVIQEGFDSLCVAPLLNGNDLLGLLIVYHDRPHTWTDDEMDTMWALAGHAGVAIKTAQNYTQLSSWAAQLQAIQQVGARLNRLSTVAEIAGTIATELRELIDYHNVRVYRIEGDELIPVAMVGNLGGYVDETPAQLSVTVGQGITGWVAQHGVAQYLPDAANDPRGQTIPGTEDDLPESMLLAPMTFEDRVLGVLVLAKLGTHQFTDDDLRLLVIFASIAAQAMANADATEQLRSQSAALERQLRSQRVLLTITESILSTLDPRQVLDQISDRLATLVEFDNISIEVYDRAAGTLRPISARGVHADEYMRDWKVGETGIATWVIERNEPVLVADEIDDPRVSHFDSTGPVHGSLIVAPLRDRDGVSGVLTLERLGEGRAYTDDEFELVKLFAAHVSISLQNATAHRAVEIRANTDGLTGLLNRSTLNEWLRRSTADGEPFSLIMLDLDDFRLVNNARGHQAGDRMLQGIAAALVKAGRDSDLVFRYGGDEFAFLLPATEAPGAIAVAERAREAVRRVPGPGSDGPRPSMAVSASIGFSTFPTDGQTAEEVLLAADRATYVAKRAGGNRVASAAEGLSLAAEFSPSEPTPVDSPSQATA